MLDKRCEESDGTIRLIVSHPCIEIWFLWHITDDLPALPETDARTYSKQCEPYKKQLIKLYPGFDKRPIEDWKKLRGALPIACAKGRKARTARVRPSTWSDLDILMKELGLPG
jgi:hypothetical protein